MSKEGSSFNKRFAVIFLFLICVLGGCTRSRNAGAQSYTNGKCVAFYAPESSLSAQYARQLCGSGEEMIFDYTVEKAGDFYKISYMDGNFFYVDEKLHDINLKVTGGEQMLSDMLRYNMKKDGIEEAYTSSFWLASAPEALDLSHITISLDDRHIHLHFLDFHYEMDLPIAYQKKLMGIDLGFEKMNTYEKKEYIDENRPMIAITYDDGPYAKVDYDLYEIFHKYGAKATFYSVGSRMSPGELDNIREGIRLGMEFGSHSEYHGNLAKQEVDEAYEEVMEPVSYVEEKLGYRMKTYRPPYGARNYELEDIIGMPAILWTVDSKDWSNRDEDITYDNIMKYVEDGDIVLMHSLYSSSEKATRRLVPDLIDRGFQLVTVSELLKYKGYDIDTIKVYGHN